MEGEYERIPDAPRDVRLCVSMPTTTVGTPKPVNEPQARVALCPSTSSAEVGSASTTLGSEPSSSISVLTEIDQLLSSKNQPEQLFIISEDSNVAHLKSRHTIFLSHSGAQKNFVEQLCEDLERANQAPFFDKKPDSLPKGEVFAQLIFQAARQCKLAIVVVSEEYFSRSKWPMLELAAFVQARNCKILPLFFGSSIKDFKNEKRRQRWFERWEAWAQSNPRIQVDVWKAALSELDRRNGMPYVKELGEVVFRKEVVATACSILEIKSLQEEVRAHPPKDISITVALERTSLLELPPNYRSIGAWTSFCLLWVPILLKVVGGVIACIDVAIIFFSYLSEVLL